MKLILTLAAVLGFAGAAAACPFGTMTPSDDTTAEIVLPTTTPTTGS
ncbi:MAG: hypothetical protein AAGE13_14425 [Pseudomonadota bacterium]